MSELSTGEKAARISSSANVDVIELKIKYAQLIDAIEQFKSKNPRAASIAQTELESSLHWAVKALTS
jgi:hypothetical protein